MTLTRWLPIAVLSCLAATVGCTSKSTPPANADASAPASPIVGEYCVAQLKRDALGWATDSPPSSTIDRHNGVHVSLRGKCLAFDDRWLVLDLPVTRPNQKRVSRELWIPIANLLTLEVRHNSDG